MLPRGAKHPGGIAVPPIRVGAGGHWPRRTSQLAPIRLCQHARGTTPKGGWRGRRRRRDAPTTSLPVCIHVTSNAPRRCHLSAPTTKLRVRRPLHHGSLASPAPPGPPPPPPGGGRGG